jgi:hypothetical protein
MKLKLTVRVQLVNVLLVLLEEVPAASSLGVELAGVSVVAQDHRVDEGMVNHVLDLGVG